MQDDRRPPEPRHDLVELAAGLVPALAGRAAGYDEADAFCHEDFDDLIASGYTAITVPAELGGRGASALDLVAAQSRLAEGNPATALAVNMHLHGVGLLTEGFRDRMEPFLKQGATGGGGVAGAGAASAALSLNMHLHGVALLTEGFSDRMEPFLKQVATDGAIVAGGFSEPQSGGNWWYQATTATPLPGGGYRLSGTKTVFTGWAGGTHLRSE